MISYHLYPEARAVSAEREKIVADRARLEQEYLVADAALKATPEYAAYIKAHHNLVEHGVLYGTGDLTREPKGIFHA